MESEKAVKEYMREKLPDCMDPLTGEYCPTKLAEDACMFFDDYEDNADIPNVYFDWAFEITEEGPSHWH